MTEIMDTFPFQFTLTEDSDGGKFLARGIFSKYDIPNQNGRVYKKSLWERVLNDQKTKSILESRQMVGELDHPADNKTSFRRVSHVITELKLMPDNTVVGCIEALNTPDGKILQELFKSGVTVGISSRATGSLKSTPQGSVVNEEDFNLITFDVVCNPSTPGAYIHAVNEEITENKELETMSAVDKFNKLEQRVNEVLTAKPANESSKKLVQGALNEAVISVTTAIQESPEISQLSNPLLESLLKRKKELAEETFGDLNTGILRTIPGQPVVQGDPLEGYAENPNLNPFMQGAETVPATAMMEEKEEDEEHGPDCKCPKCRAKKEGEPEKEEKEEMSEDVNRTEFMLEFAQNAINLPESKENAAVRALAASFLLEHENRVNEVTSLNRVVTKLQERFQEAAKSGKIIVESAGGDEKLTEKYNVALYIIEELKDRYRLLSATVYADAALDKVGLRESKEARQAVAEAIEANPTKEAIDEAVLGLVSVKGLKKPAPKLTESVVEEKKPITESKSGYSSDNIVAKLSRSMTNSRPNR